MSDLWALALGILFFAIWVAAMSYYSASHRAYTQGRVDQIRHKNRTSTYKGLPAIFYKRGRKTEAKRYKLKVHKRMSENGYGTATPR